MATMVTHPNPERDFVVRVALREDLPEVREIWADLMRIHGDIHDYYEVRDDGPRVWSNYVGRCLHDDDAKLFAAERSGKVVGFLLAHLVQRYSFYKLSRLGVVSDIAVAAECRRQGIARAMVDEALAWFRSRGMDRATANMVPANPEALAFWTAMGFDVLAEYRMRML